MVRPFSSIVIAALAAASPLAAWKAAAQAPADASDPGEPSAPAASEGLDRLVGALQSGASFKVRATAAVALGRMGDARALPPLSEAVRGDDSFAVRAAAAAALGRLGDPAGLPTLFVALHDREHLFFHSPFCALGTIGVLSQCDWRNVVDRERGHAQPPVRVKPLYIRLNPAARDYTWFSNRGNGFRVDHAWASPTLASEVRASRHDHRSRKQRITDHSALVVDLGDVGPIPLEFQ